LGDVLSKLSTAGALVLSGIEPGAEKKKLNKIKRKKKGSAL